MKRLPFTTNSGARLPTCGSPSPTAVTTSVCTAGRGTKARSYGDLPFEDYLRMARVLVGMGITKIRLTGGEPLLRKGVVEFVRELAHLRSAERRNGTEAARYRAHHQRTHAGRAGAAAERCGAIAGYGFDGRGRSRPLCAHHARAQWIRPRAGGHPRSAAGWAVAVESELRADARIQ